MEPTNYLPFPEGRIEDPDTFGQLSRILGPQAFRLTPATLAVRMSKGRWQGAPHLLFLSQIITHALNQGRARLIISMPPRHGKSKLASVRTPLWLFDWHPSWSVGIASYGADLATEFSEEVRDIILEDQDDETGEKLLRVGLKTTKVNNWSTTEDGNMYAVGVGGALYGRGVHVLLVDDYYKNAEEAESQACRDKVYDWFSTIASTRLEPNGSIIIVATRWHKDDLSGRLLSMPNSPWKEIRLPGIAEENDPLGRAPGEALWPERYSVADLLDWQATMGSYFFQAIVQQRPASSRSEVFKEYWVEVVDEELVGDDVVSIRSWDFAGTEADGDYTAGTKMNVRISTGEVQITDVVRVRYSPGKIEELIAAVAVLDGPETEIVLEQEPGASGKAVIEHYINKVLKGYRVSGTPNAKNKFVRAQPFLAACERGDVTLLRGTWNYLWLQEFSGFPEGENDDQVDSSSQGYNKVFKVSTSAGTWGRKKRGTLKSSGEKVAEDSKEQAAARIEELLRMPAEVPVGSTMVEIKKQKLPRVRMSHIAKSRFFRTTWGKR